MVKIRFDRAGIHMRKAAIVLAISQEPWAERVRCNPVDYHDLGWLWFNYPDHKVAIMKDEFYGFQEASDPLEPNIHCVTITPDPGVPEGWMMLPEPYRPQYECRTCSNCERCVPCGYCDCISPKI